MTFSGSIGCQSVLFGSLPKSLHEKLLLAFRLPFSITVRSNVIVTNCVAAALTAMRRAVLEGSAVITAHFMNRLISSSSLIVILLWTALLPAGEQVNVTQKNNHPSRDGHYIDAAFTPTNAANLVRDTGFNGAVVGNVHAQPLYIEGGANGPMVIVVTASNNVYALHADTGTVIWSRTDIGPAVTSGLPCGNENPVGINWHACCRSRVAIAFLRRIDRWTDQEAFHLFIKR